jgi:AmmeMemoRadiSam system protein A
MPYRESRRSCLAPFPYFAYVCFEVNPKDKEPFVLTEEERRILQRAARTAIECQLEGKQLPTYEGCPQSLLQPRGAFVTLHKHGKLRGCIGYVDAIKPLLQTVQEVAIKAAFEDPRFPPLDREELDQVSLEISVLTPLERVEDPSTIEVGKHGLVIELANRRGLLLPQVATEYGWDEQSFLENVAVKAGFPPEAWKHPAAKIFKFSAEVFGEEKEQRNVTP